MSQDQAASPTPAAPVVVAKPAPQPSKVDELPPFRVLLHNDDVNNADDVVSWLVEVTPLAEPAAVKVVLEADTKGVALVMVTHKERAELYADRLKSKGLTASYEPAN